MKNTDYDIIIVGAGPSGLTAAIYARRALKSVLVLEAKACGGQIINTPNIENYPVVSNISGIDFATNLYNQVKELGALIKFQRVVDVIDKDSYKEVITNEEKYTAKAVIIAVGSVNRKLGLANEDSFVGRGISYCATCDGNFYKNRDVAVVGGGNTALEDALYLSDIANKVYLIHRRDKFRGEEKIVKRLMEKGNVEFVLESNITKLIGDDRLVSIEVSKVDNTKREINISGLFIAIGRVPENDIFSKLIDLDDNGYAASGEDCKTKTPGIFVAGDNRKKEVRQLVTATSDGAVSATEAIKYINNL